MIPSKSVQKHTAGKEAENEKAKSGKPEVVLFDNEMAQMYVSGPDELNKGKRKRSDESESDEKKSSKKKSKRSKKRSGSKERKKEYFRTSEFNEETKETERP